ncbi:carbamoyltransferase HypF [Oricola thermophila]|uniref:Carbamoyltransferase HypF n=1 Tax=Oricola thermophila TaxID=2742145 RepID=A0A6N1VDU3_9HYPH|nr:carbamoyltransferase HypF [Oricola thermophila]QKV17329.1 carbamoyltransferase HypF [Oricola thermophila]
MSRVHSALTNASGRTVGRRIRVRGLVQGVGFRPHVWRLAREAGLAGHVLNDGAGVEIEAWGDEVLLDAFMERLEAEAPPLARIDGIGHERLEGAPQIAEFSIAESAEGVVSTGVVPDAATCPQCLAEVMAPADRRYGYAFTNCTHCGPRLSIVRAIPYDRASTSMAVFEMCPDCAREYADPADRRFHAQPNACPTCGPNVWLEDVSGIVDCTDPIAETAARLKAGGIAAIKGIGGFHLACDATSEDAVAELRNRKRRGAKPLAVMAKDTSQIRRFCAVTEAELELLQATSAPIVLLPKSGEPLAPSVAPGQRRVGFMLPYTPLHHLLLTAADVPLVITSGNLSNEPQAIENEEARTKLSGIADCWLMHDRDIVNRLDDSVMRVDVPGSQVLRRARGLAPEPIPLAVEFASAPPVLAAGGELKSTFCLLSGGNAVVSQHLGDLEEAATHADYRKAIALYRDIFRFEPEVVAVDLHPDYLSTQWGEALASETGARLVRVQHHHAHMASCLAEHGIEPGDDQTLGIILDGLGFGTDGTIWGGEILLGGYDGFERAARFDPVALPGGAQAMREPWRNLVAQLASAFGDGWRSRIAGTAAEKTLRDKPTDTIEQMVARGINAPLSSSAGRLFDAVAAALGICPDRQEYEGQAAMEMEALAEPWLERAGGYPAGIAKQGNMRTISWQPLWDALARDLDKGVEPGLIAAKFHCGIASALAGTAIEIAETSNAFRIALSGGVMQNRILTGLLHATLAGRGFEVLVQARVPANDGGLSLGQAVIAARASDA